MKRFLLLPLLVLLTTCQPLYAGYAVYIAPQIPEFITVNGVSGPEQWPNRQKLHPDNVCKVPGYSQYSPDAASRTEVIRSDSGTLTEAEVLALCPTVLNGKYEALWTAAHNWEQLHISGVGLSILSLGVAQGKPKSLAVAAWSNALWNGIYYPRKALISLDSEPDLDFSVAGPMPYSVPELSAEVWQ